jgi:hypothetical protein
MRCLNVVGLSHTPACAMHTLSLFFLLIWSLINQFYFFVSNSLITLIYLFFWSLILKWFFNLVPYFIPPELNQGPTRIKDGKRNKWDKLSYMVSLL